jgi:hypothetical protein
MSKHLYILIIFGQIISFAAAQTDMVFIPNVPDHSQPPDTTLPSTKNDRSNYCAPFAYVNIVEYWESVYIHPNAQGMMGGLPAKQIVEYIGWFLDTNDEGSPARFNGTDPQTYPSALGTYVIDQSNGMQEFVNYDISNTYGFAYTPLPAKKAYPWHLSPPHPEDFAAAYIAEIGMGRPVKLDFLYWNPIPTGDSIIVPGGESEIIYIYQWGQQIDNTGLIDKENIPWEEWNLEQGSIESNIGHAVTGVGYILDTLEFAIVHDNWSTTPKNIAIPWRSSQGVPMVTAMVLVNLPPAVVKISLPDTTTLTGEQLLIPVKTEDLTGLHVHTYFMNIVYNTSVLQAKGATAVNSLSAAWGTPGVDLSTPGDFIVSHSGSPELSGAGDLVYLQFDVIGSVGDSSQLRTKAMVFNFGDPAADTLSGSVKIVPRAINVTIASNPTGLQIEVDGTSYSAPKVFNWQEGDSHNLNALSPQVGNSGTRYVFDAWGNTDNMMQTITVSVNDTMFTANYFKEYELTTAVNPDASGTITVSPEQNWFRVNSEVILHAIAESNYAFLEWQGDHSGSKNPDTLIIDQAKEITAQFTSLTKVTPENRTGIPKKYALDQCFPNPFNPSTIIRYQLPRTDYIELNVYNILGEKIATLMHGTMLAGYHKVEFDGHRLPSGIYIYKIKAGNFTAVKKMILAK